jgi:acetyl-CoA/propionyl-CoA carboxylase biotin carboxyl carrier protein
VGDGSGFAVHTRWIDEVFLPSAGESTGEDGMPEEAPIRLGRRTLSVRLPGLALLDGAAAEAVRHGIRQRSQGGGPQLAPTNLVVSPMQGTVIQVAVEEGQEVSAGDLVAVVEAMKMENPVRAGIDGVVQDLSVKTGDTVAQDAVLCRLRRP